MLRVNIHYLLFCILGYLLGGILFAPFFGRILANKDIVAESKDNNPGTANAYMHGNFLCGTLTLLCDVAKGFLPVFLCLRMGNNEMLISGMALVMAAPVAGHVFSLYNHFKGGKGIATTFGCLLGFIPDLRPALILASFFIFFSLIIRITPHFSRTVVTYLCTLIELLFIKKYMAVKLGFLLITVCVYIRLYLSGEKKRKE